MNEREREETRAHTHKGTRSHSHAHLSGKQIFKSFEKHIGNLSHLDRGFVLHTRLASHSHIHSWSGTIDNFIARVQQTCKHADIVFHL